VPWSVTEQISDGLELFQVIADDLENVTLSILLFVMQRTVTPSAQGATE
jgi:hypothetical protein